MFNFRTLIVIFLVVLCVLFVVAAVNMADAVVANTSTEEDETLFSTFSLCTINPETGESGAAVTTRVAFVGRAVPWARAGVGAVATQSWTVVEYGLQGLDLMEKGVAPADALEQMMADDEGKERRQVGLINMKGEAAAFTGKECGDWAGHKQGKNYTVQANIMVGPEVIEAVSAQFESTEGTGMPLAERMILAMEAGQKTGGDKRWGRFQSAAIVIADPDNPGRGNDHISLSIRVGEHPEPVQEMKRIYYKTQNRLGYREFSEIQGGDVLELKRMLHKLSYWRKEMAEFPERPRFEVDPKLQTENPEEYERLVSEYRTKARKYNADYAKFDDETIEAVDAYRKDRKMEYTGNARGLVDARFVEALKKEYLAKMKESAK